MLRHLYIVVQVYSVAMGRFYLDLEFTNGNYYLADVIEMSMVAEDTNHEFHRYVKIHYPLPYVVRQLTCITDEKLNADGCSFKDAMQALVDFIYKESDGSPTIIAHGGYLHDFPILLANCLKYEFQDFHVLQRCTFVDSVQHLQDIGYRKPGLDALCRNLGLSRCTHSALEDARLLKTVFQKLLLQPSYSYSFIDIKSYLRSKMPIEIPTVYRWSKQCWSSRDLESILLKFVRKKTALNNNQVAKISRFYFENCN